MQVVAGLVRVVLAVGVPAADLVDVVAHVLGASSPAGPRTRWRGRTSGSSPSTSANTTHSAERCSAAASTTARTSASEPSMVRTSAPEIRSNARITRRSRSAAIRYSG